MSEVCGKCGYPIGPSDTLRRYGWYVAHAEERCHVLMQAEITALRVRLAEVEAERDASVEAVHIHAADMVRRAMQALPDDVALGMADPGCDADLERQASEALDAGCGAGDVARATAKSRKARAQTARETVAKALTKCFAADKEFRQDALARVQAEAVRKAVEGLSVSLIRKELCPPVDEHGNMEWWFNDAESFRSALLAALLPNDPEARDV